MFKTVHLNCGFWGKALLSLRIGKHDPLLVFSKDENDFSEAMKSFKFGQVYKYTQAGRHLATQGFINEWVLKNNIKPLIVDIGASDGVTSMELIKLLGEKFKEYYVTDYNIQCTYANKDGRTYFFDHSGNCFMVASKKFVYYPSNKKIFDFLFKKNIEQLEKVDKADLLLIVKNLQHQKFTDSRIKIMPYNIFEPWQLGTSDVVVVANLLNRVYFTDEEIRTALENCYNTLNDKGLFAVIRNQKAGRDAEIEKSNVYQKDSASKSFKKIFEKNQGVEINDFIVSHKFK